MGLQVVGVDVNDEALAAATNLGADATVNSKTNPDFVEDVKKVTGKGAHAVAVLTGSDVAFAAAPRLLRAGGLLMAIGMAKEDLRVSTFELAIGKYRIKGESSSTPQRMHKAVEFTAKHRIQPDVEFRRLEDLPRMVDDMIAGRATRRQVVRF